MRQEKKQPDSLLDKIISWPVSLAILGVGVVMIYAATFALSLAWLGTVGAVVAVVGGLAVVIRFLRG